MKRFTLTIISAFLGIYLVLAQSIFKPVWEGNGVDQMNIYLYGAKINGTDLKPGDTIGVFDGIYCVGYSVVQKTITTTDYLQIITSADDDPIDTIVNGFTAGNPILFRLYSQDAGKIIYNINITPYYTVGAGIFIKDGSASLSIDAKTPNNPPVIVHAGDTTATEDADFVYLIQATDPDAGDVVTIIVDSIPTWLTATKISSGVIKLSGKPDDPDLLTSKRVHLFVHDKFGATIQKAFTIAINPVNDPPEFSSAAISVVKTSGKYTYNIVATDQDVGDSVSITAVTTLPTWLTLDPVGNGTSKLYTKNAQVAPGTPGAFQLR